MDEAIVVAADVVTEFVGVLAALAVMMWWYKFGVNGNSCCSRGCSPADLLYTI
jgi:hypothetical protein